MSRGRAYLSSREQELYMVELIVKYPEDSPRMDLEIYFGPYGTLGAARGKRTSEINDRLSPFRKTAPVEVTGRVFKCQPEWEEVEDA